MICYRDKTFCSFWLLCKHGNVCDRALTEKVKSCAKEFGLPVCQFAEYPRCFVPFFSDATKTENCHHATERAMDED